MTAQPSPTPRTPSSRARTIRRALLVTALALLGAYWLLFHSFLTRRVVASKLSGALGMPVSASSVDISPFSSRVVASNIAAHAPGVLGDAGAFFSARRIVVDLDLVSALRGNPQVRAVSVEQPVIRLSQSRDDASVNVAALGSGTLAGGKPAGTSQTFQVPQLSVQEGTLELGEHTKDGSYTALKTIHVAGVIEPSADDTDASIINFREVGNAPGALAVRGRLSKDNVAVTLTGLDLTTVAPTNIPTAARELYAQSHLAGKVPEAEIVYEFAGSWRAKLKLQDVGITLPVEVQPDEDEHGNPLPLDPVTPRDRMRLLHSSGVVTLSQTKTTAQITGLLEDLPYEVDFAMDGIAASAPWTCTLTTRGFHLERRPQILRFAPGLVRRRLGEFNDPTGVLDAAVTVSSKGEQAPVSVRGELRLRDVRASFHKFPYAWKNIQGRVTFDDTRVLLQDIQGVSDSGAIITAQGFIEPPSGPDAGFDIDVRVKNLHIDESVRAAMRARGQDAVLPSLLDEHAYAQRIEQGLLRPARDIPGITPNPAAPAFDLGGEVSVRVNVHRDRGLEAEWTDSVTIDLIDVGILPQAFPYPLRARGIRVIQQDGVATVSGGELMGLSGGHATVYARADLTKAQSSVDSSNPAGGFTPDMDLEAHDIPFDALLLHALPEPAPGDRPLRDIIAPLHATGTLDANITIREGGERDHYRIDATTRNATCTPLAPDGSSRVLAKNLTGTLLVDDASVDLHLDGQLAEGDTAAPASVQLNSDPGPEGVRCTTRAESLPLAMHVEDFAACFAQAASDSITQVRQEYNPVGLADATVMVNAPRSSGTHVVTTLTPKGDLTAQLPGAVATFHDLSGKASIFAGEGEATVVSLDSLSTRAEALGQPIGTLKLHGAFAPGKHDGERALRVQATDLRLGAPQTRPLLLAGGADKVLDLCDRFAVASTLDANLLIQRAKGAEASSIKGSLKPHALAFTVRNQRASFENVTGEVHIDGNRGEGRALQLTAPTWNLLLDGAWVTEETGSTIDATMTLSAESLSPDLVVLLPRAMRESLEDLQAQVRGPVATAETPLRVHMAPDGSVVSAMSAGQFAVEDASLDIGVKIEQASAILDYRFDLLKGHDAGSFTLTGDLPSFRAGGMRMTHGRVHLDALETGEVVVPEFSARAYGGRVSGAARVGILAWQPDFVGPPLPGRPFDISVESSNLRFAPLLEDFRATVNTDAPAAKPLDDLDDSRGSLAGSMTLSGITNLPPSRRGRGTLTVTGGNVVSFPTLVPLAKITNLQLPNQEPIDYALADFYLQGGTLNFEQVSISSNSVGLYGFGSATWPDMNLDMRFRVGNRSRIPIITPVLESLRGELMTAVVKGPASNPDVNMVAFEGTRRTIDEILGGGRTPEERRLDMLEKSVSPSQRRSRPDELPPVEPIKTVDGSH